MKAAALFDVEATTVFSREWAMPSPETFAVAPIADLLRRNLPSGTVVDPFSRGNKFASITNDLDPSVGAMYSLEAGEFCDLMACQFGQFADAVLFDPPYSPRQISEVYKRIGLAVGTEETQNARLYKRVKDGLDRLLKPGGVAICCGWNSSGFGKGRGYDLREVLLVAHGGAHNDTIVTVEVKR